MDDLFKNTAHAPASTKNDLSEKAMSKQDVIPMEQHQFYNCDFSGLTAFKDDMAGMDVPIFTLNIRTPDLSIFEWKSEDGSREIKIVPSVLGRATQLDKNLLIYAISQLTEGLNKGDDSAKNKTVRFKIYDFLKATGKDVGGKDYKRVRAQLERLRGTSMTTTIKTGRKSTANGFGLIDKWEIVTGGPDDTIFEVEMTLSQWLYNSIQAKEVLTINPEYFSLKKTTEMKLYEIARKYCNSKPRFKIGAENLITKLGNNLSLREFRRTIKEVGESNNIPDYQYTMEDGSDYVMIVNKNTSSMLE